jgi:hypothetical protein
MVCFKVLTNVVAEVKWIKYWLRLGHMREVTKKAHFKRQTHSLNGALDMEVFHCG